MTTWAGTSAQCTYQNDVGTQARFLNTGHVMPAGTDAVLTGSYTGDGVTEREITGLGFRPDVVIVKAVDEGKEAVIRTASMGGDLAKKMAGGEAPQADRIQSLDADGFTIGTTDFVNKNGATYTWIALKASATTMTLGTYTGTGSSQSISNLGFSPELVYVFHAGNQEGLYRAAGDTEAYDFGGSANANTISSLDADGFTVATDDRVNKSGETYYYVAWNEFDGLMKVDSYTGDGTDNRNITGLGFTPEWAAIATSGRAPGSAAARSSPPALWPHRRSSSTSRPSPSGS